MKCKICGKEFELFYKNKYIVSTASRLGYKERKYEAFDCPYCGCQHIVNIREEKVDDN